MRDPEYDRFGPWVIEISELDPLPPLFLPFLTREEKPLLSVKIPRQIERRNAHPGMNLYDYLVTLYEEDLIILQRDGEEVRQERFFYHDIQFLRYSENLLKGNLCLGTAVMSYDLPFNTTSKELMRRVVDLIRERYSGGAGVVMKGEAPDIAQGELSFYFSRLLAREKKQFPERRLLATQSDTAIGFSETGVLRRVLFGAASKTLLESLHFCDGRELKVITRSKAYKYRWQTEYGASTYIIPLLNISGVSWEEDAQNTAVTTLTVQTAGEPVSFAFIRHNPWLESYDRFLAAVLQPVGEAAS